MGSRATVGIACIFVFLAPFGCSLLLDKRADQCASDDECRQFPGTRCDMPVRLCVPLSVATEPRTDAAMEAGDPCTGPGACYRCAPTNDLQFQNGCTNASCVPFSNERRIKRFQPEGGLAPLPE